MAENTDTLEVLKQLAQQVRNATAEGENTAERVGRTLVGIIDHLGDGDSITEGMLDEKLEDYPTKQEVTIAMSRYVTTDFFARLFAPEGEDGAEVDVNDMETVINAVRVKFGLHTDSYISAKGNNPESGSTVSGASALVDLSDVDISNPQDGQILSWNGTKWVNADAPSAGLDETALAEYLTTNHYAKTTDIPSLEGYATQTWASGQFALKTVAINAGTGLTGGGNLSANRTLSLATVGTAGTYTKVTVDAYGRVTGHGSLAAGDIPALAISKITGLQDALDAKMDAADFEELFEKVYVSGYGYAIRAKLALYTDSWMSAKGSNPDAGSVSAGLDEEQLAEYLTEHGYATQSWVKQQGYLTEGAEIDLSGYATQSWVNSQGFLKSVSVSDVTGLQEALDEKMDADDRADFLRFVDTVTADGDTLYSAIGIRSFSGCYPDSLPAGMRWYNYGEAISFPVPNGMRFDLYANHHSSSSLSTYNRNGLMFRTGFHNNTINDWRMILDSTNYNGYVTTLDNLTHAVASDYIQVGSARLRYDSANNALYVQKSDGTQCGFYATGFVSAKGANSDAGSAVAGVTELSELEDVTISSPSNGQALVYRNGVWKNEAIETGLTSVSWGDVKGKPTTLAGYGITDAYTKTEADERYVNVSGDTMTGGLSIKTYNYGDALNVIRNSNTSAGAISFSNNTGLLGIIGVGGSSMNEHQPIFSQSGSGEVYMIWHSGNDGSGSGLDADLLDGVHLSDIRNGNVYSATRLQTARTLWGQSFNGTANVSGDMTGVGNITMSGTLATPSSVTASVVTASEFLLPDEHLRIFHDASTGYAYVQGPSSGKLRFSGLWGTTLSELYVQAGSSVFSGSIQTNSYIQVGSARLMWDSTNNALYVQKSDGTACGFYATGFVSAKGANDDGGDTEATVLTIADERNTAIYPDTYAGRGIRGLFRANATDGLNDGGTYHTVLHIRQWANSSGGLSHQLAFTDNGGVWHRTALSETAWGEWSELSALSGLGDVQISSPSNGQSLVYRNGIWKNETVSGGGSSSVAWADVTGKPSWIGSTKPSYSFSEITGTPSISISSSSGTNLSVEVEGSGRTVPSLYATYLGGTTKQGLFTGLTYSSNKLSVTIGGTTKSVTINAGGGSSLANVSDDSSGIVVKATSGTFVSIVGQSKPFYIDSQSGQTVGLRFEGNAETGVGVNMEAFKPLSAAAGKLYLGTSAARWRTVYSVNSLNTSSDLRLKDVRAAIPLTVAQVAAAPSFLYRWKKGADTSLHAGSSAQYWQQALPQAVTEGADGYLAMEYDRIALAAAITVARAVADHETRIRRLEQQLDKTPASTP